MADYDLQLFIKFNFFFFKKKKTQFGWMICVSTHIRNKVGFYIGLFVLVFLVAENLLMTADHKIVKLADFGLAREESLTEMMTAETGTYRWMAPEVLRKKGTVYISQSSSFL